MLERLLETIERDAQGYELLEDVLPAAARAVERFDTGDPVLPLRVHAAEQHVVLQYRLEREDDELWLARLKRREARIRDRARQLGVELDEGQLRVAALSTSRSQLAAVWEERRRVLPDTRGEHQRVHPTKHRVIGADVFPHAVHEHIDRETRASIAHPRRFLEQLPHVVRETREAEETGLRATRLSADGTTVLGATGGFDPDGRHDVVTVPYAGGKPTLLARNAFNPDWTR